MKAYVRHDVEGRSIVIVPRADGTYTLFAIPYNAGLAYLEITTSDKTWYPGAPKQRDEPEETELPDDLYPELLLCYNIGEQPNRDTALRLRQMVLVHRGTAQQNRSVHDLCYHSPMG